MGRNRQSFTREAEYLEARKILVIAFEGARGKAEDRYFEGIQSLANELCTPNPPRIHIKSISNFENKSAPHHIFDNLQKFQANYELDYDENESFLLIDWDSHEANITNFNIVEKCKDLDFHFTICKPCFELWLLLHFLDIDESSSSEKEKILENQRVSNSKRYIDQLLFESCGSSNKSNLKFSNYREHIYTAISNAKKIEVNDNPIPDGLAARAFVIVENILSICSN